MKFKELLKNIEVEIKKSSNKTNSNIEEMKTKIDTLENKLNLQNSRLLKFFEKIDEIKQINLDAATVLEEMAFYLLEETNEQMPVQHKDSDVTITTIKEKYIN